MSLLVHVEDRVQAVDVEAGRDAVAARQEAEELVLGDNHGVILVLAQHCREMFADGQHLLLREHGGHVHVGKF
jgi:hypothetical protein